MAIKVRRGNKVDFDQNKLLGGELALVLDEGELYFCYGAGNTKRLQTRDDLTELMELHPDAIQALYDLAQDGTLTTVLNEVGNMQTIVSDIETNYNTMYAEKETALDGLYTTKNNSLSGLEVDYGNKADILETTYAPRLTGLENSRIGTNFAIDTSQYYQSINFTVGKSYLGPTGISNLKEGDKVTLSAYLSNITAVGGVALEVSFSDSGDAEIGVATGNFVTTDGLYTFTLTVPEGVASGEIYATLNNTNSIDNGARIRSLKLELGNLVTPWKPSIYRLPALEYEFNAHLAESASKHITESGTNDNGEYIKFDNGTMICSRTANINLATKGLKYLAFPSSFITTPYYVSHEFVTTEGNATLRSVMRNCFTAFTDSTSVNIENYETFDITRSVRIFAIGEWK